MEITNQWKGWKDACGWHMGKQPLGLPEKQGQISGRSRQMLEGSNEEAFSLLLLLLLFWKGAGFLRGRLSAWKSKKIKEKTNFP